MWNGGGDARLQSKPGQTCSTPCFLGGPTCGADASVCGDGILQPGETCDFDKLTGRPLLVPGCRPSSCTYCGDGVVQVGLETCDGNKNADGTTVECRDTCTYCGDGTVDVNDGEICDIKNDLTCQSDCTRDPNTCDCTDIFGQPPQILNVPSSSTVRPRYRPTLWHLRLVKRQLPWLFPFPSKTIEVSNAARESSYASGARQIAHA